MQALVIAHDPDSTAELVGERLVDHGFQLDELVVCESLDDPRSDVSFPDPADYDLILPMGSIWSVYDDATIGSWIGRELELLRRADEADVPVLGICFGGQALAAALGGLVVPTEHKQIGWYHLDSHVAGLATGPWLQWHSDRFDPPTDATVVARDHTCVQAFRIRRHLGLQFHPEATARLLAGWMAWGGDREVIEFGGDPQHILDEAERMSGTVEANTKLLVDWFLTEVAGLVPPSTRS